MLESIWLVATAGVMASVGILMESPAKPPRIAPARYGDIAIQEELCATRKTGTVAAYDLFIARHPKHALTEVAERDRNKVQRQR